MTKKYSFFFQGVAAESSQNAEAVLNLQTADAALQRELGSAKVQIAKNQDRIKVNCFVHFFMSCFFFSPFHFISRT